MNDDSDLPKFPAVPATVAEYIRKAREAGHDALGIANDHEFSEIHYRLKGWKEALDEISKSAQTSIEEINAYAHQDVSSSALKCAYRYIIGECERLRDRGPR